MPRPPSSSSCDLPPRVAVSILRENARICEEYFKRSGPSSNEDGMPIVRRTSQLPFDADSDSVAETCVAHGRSEECPRLRLMRTAAMASGLGLGQGPWPWSWPWPSISDLISHIWSGGLESRAIDFGSDLAHICIWSLVIGPWRLVPGPGSLVPQSVDLQSVRSTGPDSKSVIRECGFPECRPPFCFIVFQDQ